MEVLKMKTQNREEIFLKALANGKEPNIKPLTRKEILLKKQAERESASGGGAFVVNFYTEDMQTCTADKTLDEVCEAVKNDMVVIGNVFLGFDPEHKWVLPCYGGAVDGELKQIDFGKFQINGNGSVQFAYVIYHATNGIKFRTQMYTPS
jgi:hypothetical protein